MKVSAALEGNKFRSMSYKKRIICLQFSVLALSCCFGIIGLSLCFLHNTNRYGQHSADVNNPLRSLMNFSNDIHEAKSIYQSNQKTGSSLERSYIHDYDRTSLTTGNSSFFGSVMHAFACRVLSRHITSSNILVITPGAVLLAKEAFKLIETEEMYTSNDLQKTHSVGGAFLQYGVLEGHTIHAISSLHSEKESQKGKSQPTLDTWLNSFDVDKVSNDSSKWWCSTKPHDKPACDKPTWILLAVFDLPFGSENSVWEEAEYFLEACTVTYIVIAIHSTKRQDGSYKFGGMDAIESLLDRKYKLQVLSSSHYHANKSNAREIFERYGPNALFQSAEKFEGFLRWGADAAQRYGKPKDDLFTSYIFATQGLDLAIPTPQVYLRDGAKEIDVFNKHAMDNLPPLKSCLEANSEGLDFYFNEVSGCAHFSLRSSVLTCFLTVDSLATTIDFFTFKFAK